jgi:VanZ family protein
MVFQSQLFKHNDSGDDGVGRGRRKLPALFCLITGTALAAWCVTPWWNHDWYKSTIEEPLQLWLYGMPRAKAPWYLHADFHFHFITSFTLGLWLSWARRLWLPSLVWWLPFLIVGIAVCADEIFQYFSLTRIAEWNDLAHDLAGILTALCVHWLSRTQEEKGNA